MGFPDEDERSPYPPDDPDLLKNRPVLDRLVVMSAGVMANLIFAYLVLVLMFASVGIPSVARIHPGILIPQVMTDSPAERAGLQAEDVVLRAADHDYSAIADETAALAALNDFQALIRSSENQPVALKVQRGAGDPFQLTVIPELRGDGGHWGDLSAQPGADLAPRPEPGRDLHRGWKRLPAGGDAECKRFAAVG